MTEHLYVVPVAPDASVIACLEDALARARAGEVLGIGLVMSCAGRAEATSYALGSGSVAALVLATERLKMRLLAIGGDE